MRGPSTPHNESCSHLQDQFLASVHSHQKEITQIKILSHSHSLNCHCRHLPQIKSKVRSRWCLHGPAFPDGSWHKSRHYSV
jgi:hypothetical protein